MSTHARIDVKLTDGAALKLLKDRSVNGYIRITFEEVATSLGCHWATAFRCMGRLEASGYITREGGGRRVGMVYRVVE